ncbi:hypothetical protein Psta_1289 [Pirellula staleyi DSM 6068]|uniref:Uncharacterized protein n=1 Tax=Pirellula staleyi (strain ATCC 27377 / DSM 6068 / ICPB 4128) TaxID=530564 RepID=D2QW92_PIRSD|nr:hypothetical protein Psta_1289 [Pirellula staleyi DSM 6068]
MKPIIGDKVRVKATKERGVVESLDGRKIQVRLETGLLTPVTELEITNYSMAARKAWKSMPNRRVGRPNGTTTTDRVSVTLRIDRKLWEAFKSAEERGAVADRTATINKWISEKLRQLEA